ncbi:restriction endonuclease subunit S [Paenarthrobacter sp. PH39-S1]|uniref:restriction endonuclease subunit S n=1 Tax=Paenarthrobacter sp. PH39-S1 TaxID=3046204 RepID=UPI0024BBC696|nr:restriction endonuclease subunit S [Paenarthrobacter sp. PH39-S1]MDJ0355460.1 restriction endonuclease subunit S [Paenarthrobacter sp. PH39-S1]
MSDISAIRLYEVLQVKHGFAFPGDEFGDDPAYPTLVTPGNFAIGGGFKDTKPKTFLGPYPESYRLAPNDLIVTMTDLSKEGDTLGLPALVPSTGEYLHNQRIGLVEITDPFRLDKFFLNYMLRTSAYRAHIIGTASGSTVRHTSPSRIGDYKTNIPPLMVQRAIAEVLGALDDKIAANTKLAATAVQLMHASYRRMMITVPTETRVVESLVERMPAPHKVTKSDIQAVGDTPVFDQSEAGLLGHVSNMPSFMADEENPVLFFGDHTCKLRISVRNFALGPNTIPFKARELPEVVLFCALQGVQQHEEYKRHWLNLTKKEVRVPGAAHAESFRATFSGVLSLLQSRELESRALEATRDALLPQLMSGKLRVRDAEKVLETVVRA